MKRKATSILLTAIMLTATLLTGCGNGSSEQTATNVASTQQVESKNDTSTKEEKIVVEFWNVFTGSDGDILRTIVDTYNATNTDNVEVKMDIMPNAQLQQKLPASIATGTATDLVLFGVEYIALYVTKDSRDYTSSFW